MQPFPRYALTKHSSQSHRQTAKSTIRQIPAEQWIITCILLNIRSRASLIVLSNYSNGSSELKSSFVTYLTLYPKCVYSIRRFLPSLNMHSSSITRVTTGVIHSQAHQVWLAALSPSQGLTGKDKEPGYSCHTTQLLVISSVVMVQGQWTPVLLLPALPCCPLSGDRFLQGSSLRFLEQ